MRLLSGFVQAARRMGRCALTCAVVVTLWLFAAASSGCSSPKQPAADASSRSPSPGVLLASGQLSGARSETVDLGVHELGEDVRLAWTLTGGPESRAVFTLRLVRTSDGLGASVTMGPFSFPGEMTRITNDRGMSLAALEPGSYHAYVSQKVRPEWPEGIAADFELYTSAE